MTARENRPPRAVRRLLGILLPGPRGTEALEDLDHAYAGLRDRYPSLLASAWYVLLLFRPDTWRLALVLRRIHGAETCEGRKEHRRRRRRGVIPWLEARLAVRMLGRYPGLAFVAVFAMAVGVTAVVGVFSFTSNFLDPTLPLPEGNRVVGLQNWNAATTSAEPSSLRDLETWTEALRSVGEIGAAHLFERNLTAGDAPGEPVRGAEVTPSTFRLARVPPLLGRPLVESDTRSGSRDVAVIGYDLWQRTFAGDPLVLGRRIEVGGSDYTVVGVMPEGFGFPVSQSLWIPLRTEVTPGLGVGSPALLVFGRLRLGVSLAQAQAEMSVAGNRRRGDADRPSELRPRVVPYVQSVQTFPDAMLIGARLSLLMLLLVVCANVGALVFARNLSREGEIAIRMSLGASRRRVMLQLFFESLALAGLASLVALVVSSCALTWGRTLLLAGSGGMGSVPFWWRLKLSSTAVMWVAVLTLLNAGICGLLPALPLTSRRLGPRLQRSGAGTSSLGFGRTVKTVMATQVALSVMFLTLTLGSWQRLNFGQPDLKGLAAERYLTAELRPGSQVGSEEGSSELLSRFERDRRALAERLASDHRVAGVAFADRLPGDNREDMLMQVEGGPVFELPTVHIANVSARYFEVLNRPLLAGRVFDENDVAPDGRAHPVIVVGRSFARRWLGDRHAVGRRLRFIKGHDLPGPWFEVVGVVGRPGPEEAHVPDGVPNLFRPLSGTLATARVLIRTADGPARLVSTLRTRAAEVDPALRVTRVNPLNVVLAADRARHRFVFAALLIAALMAMLLAIGGVYSVMSFFVSRRTREIGIRTALGAGSARLTLGIFSAAAHQLGLGLLFGLATAIPLSSWALEVGSVGVALEVSGVLIVAGLAACIGPTRRMLRVQPTEAMRADA